MAAVPIVPR